MTRARTYRAALPAAAALAELWRCSGTQFDPEVVRAFADALEAHAASTPGRWPRRPRDVLETARTRVLSLRGGRGSRLP